MDPSGLVVRQSLGGSNVTVPERRTPVVVSETVRSGFHPVGQPRLSRAVAYSSVAPHVLLPARARLMLISRNFSG